MEFITSTSRQGEFGEEDSRVPKARVELSSPRTIFDSNSMSK